MSKVAIVTGASSGIGKATAEALRLRGYTVYYFSRRETSLEGIRHIYCDVSDDQTVKDAVKTVMDESGRIDLLVNNAGFGISGAVEFTETADAERLFDVLFFGIVRMNKAVLPIMREQGSGKIVNISSVAAVTPIPFQTYYSAAKSAVLSYSMALANEVKEFGIQVSAILPGDIKTGFTEARDKSVLGDDVYGGRITRSVARMEHDEQNGTSPVTIGATIASICASRRSRPVYTLGLSYRFLVALAKRVPYTFLNYVLKLMYGK